MTPLEKAIYDEERAVRDAIDRLRVVSDASDDLEAIADSLRLSHALLGCLRRLTRGRTVQELHAAFGAPGDYGYETPVGDALARAYGVTGGTSSPQHRLFAAIRRFTVDDPNGKPIYRADHAMLRLQDATAVADIQEIRAAAAEFCDASADDSQELREAAEAFFGGDFRTPEGRNPR